MPQVSQAARSGPLRADRLMARARRTYQGLEVQIGPFMVPITIKPLDDEYGKFEERPYRVSIAPDLPPRERASTVIHGLLHAVEAVRGVTLGEGKVRALETALVEAFLDNPELMRLLAADLEG